MKLPVVKRKKEKKRKRRKKEKKKKRRKVINKKSKSQTRSRERHLFFKSTHTKPRPEIKFQKYTSLSKLRIYLSH